jgi:hypothetical protein
MKPRKKPLRVPVEKKAVDVLEQFVDIFAGRGWLDQTLRIKHRDKKYRLYCSETVFTAYRINDYCGISHGFPGWPVCFVTPDQIIEDSDMSKFSTTEPSVHDWLRCIADDDMELI